MNVNLQGAKVERGANDYPEKHNAAVDIIQAWLSSFPESGFNFRGGHSAAGGSFPSGPASGDLWVITAPGTMGGAAYGVGDRLVRAGSTWTRIAMPMVQSSPTDTTPGALMAVGAFGLGGASGPEVALNDAVIQGLYRYAASDPNAPDGSNGCAIVMAHTGNYVTQLAIVRGGFRTYVRNRNSSAVWSSWVEIPNTSGSHTWTGSQTFNAGTQLGESGPKIKTRKLSGTMPAAEGASIGIAHGLPAGRVLGVQILVAFAYPPGYTYLPGWEYNFRMTSTQLQLQTVAGNSASVLGLAFNAFITYEE